jgi:hypothetical protein
MNKDNKREKCDGVDMATGLRDCWNFFCKKDHTWRFYELHNQPERSKREDSCKKFHCKRCGALNTIR